MVARVRCYPEGRVEGTSEVIFSKEPEQVLCTILRRYHTKERKGKRETEKESTIRKATFLLNQDSQLDFLLQLFQ
uniref:Uncharacterized protein n=1 Tax=Vespula pensylvanica TaxID=30213 RepID=A0A834NKM0_VESPE|nr:hypothetical protein H0235_013535 [Vespula pensylvanica]